MKFLNLNKQFPYNYEIKLFATTATRTSTVNIAEFLANGVLLCFKKWRTEKPCKR